jgi:general secretion pathway protein G
MRIHRSRRTGFTLIEMSVVVAIIGMLAMTVVPIYGDTIHRARETALKDTLHTVRRVLDQYHRDHEAWPPSLEALVSQGYLRALPVDPFTRVADSWKAIPSEPGEADVYDVRSGATGSTLEGVPLSDL